MATEDLTLSDVTQTQFDAAEAIIIALARAEYPTLDLRKGTVLRDMLIRPAAAFYALDEARMEQLRQQQSLTELLANEATVDPDAVNAILSNFNMTRATGELATGTVLVKVSAVRAYTVAAGFQFITLAGLKYEVSTTYTIKQGATGASEIELQTANDGSYYYFLVPVSAAEVGAAYNIAEGTNLDALAPLFGFISAEAYTSFVAGLDDESVSEVIARLPVAISNRSLTSRTSIEAKLRDAFAGSAYTIQSLSAQGMGDAAQLRDQHNPMGFSVGSRVDIYLRTFHTPNVTVLQKTGTKISENTYQITLAAGEAPGYYAIRAITDAEAAVSPVSNFGALPAVGSYPFTETRAASGLAATFHDIDTANSMIETYGSVFQAATINVEQVVASDATRQFKVELYTAPGLAAMQAYVDTTAVRNVEADIICRCPLMCTVGLNAKLYYRPGNAVDIQQLTTDICSYINGRSFVAHLTRSELAALMLEAGAIHVDLSTKGTTLQGTIRDAAGVTHVLSGDSLSITSIEDYSALLAENTCVFAAEPHNITIQAISEAEG